MTRDDPTSPRRHRAAARHPRRARELALATAIAAALVGGVATASPASPGTAEQTGEARAPRPARQPAIEVSGPSHAISAASDLAVERGGVATPTIGGGILVNDLDAFDALAIAVVAAEHGGVTRTPRSVDVDPDAVTPDAPTYAPAPDSAAPVIGADAWHAIGVDGSGVKIGVVDFFDVSLYWDESIHGPTPVAGVNATCLESGVDCTDEFFDDVDDGSESHGTDIVELIRDIAPGAEIFIGQAFSIDDYHALIEWFAERDVTIINRSLGGRYDGPGDGRGPLDDVAAEAIERGILWVNSGGNNANGRYYRGQAKLVGNRVGFGPDGDLFLEFVNCATLGGVRWANDWDMQPADRTDYDVHIWRSPVGDPASGTVVASSTDDQRTWAPPVENIADTVCPTADTALYLEITHEGGDTAGDIIEVLDYGGGFVEHGQAQYSASTPVVDSDLMGVVAVGAIDPAEGDTVADYSSRGPTNDGRTAPDIVAPAGFRLDDGSLFAGTSAAAAVVTGGAAILSDADMAADPTSLGSLIRHTAADHGATGADSSFGHGEFVLPDPALTEVDDRPSRFIGVDTPTRLLDTREATAVGPDDLVGAYEPGEIRDLPITGTNGIPDDGVSAVMVNIATIAADRPSFVQALPTLGAEVGGFSNLNNDASGQVRANLAIVPVGANGSISLYTIGAGDLVVDLVGWFEPAPEPPSDGRFVEFDTPQRLFDSRVDGDGTPLRSGDTVVVAGPDNGETAAVGAVVVTVTGTAATDPGWIQALPVDRPDARGATSTVNLVEGETAANLSVVPVDAGGQIAITSYFADGGSAHVVVDSLGYFTSDAAESGEDGLFVSVSPDRAYDSRDTSGGLLDGQLVEVDAGAAQAANVPDDAAAVVWNLAALAADRPGFARAWATGAPEPPTSALNWIFRGDTRAGAAIVAVGGGRTSVRVDDGDADAPTRLVGLIADVFGYFT